MSNTLSILVRGNVSFVSIKDCLESFVGHRFTKSEEVDWNLYEAYVLGMHISLFDEPGFVDDSGIMFSQYPFVIDVDTASMTLEDDIKQDCSKCFSSLLANTLTKHVHCDCVVVENLQRVVATFTP